MISRQWEDGAGCRAALPEHSHVGVAEAVDRLELVADDEEISPGPLREEVEQLGLETVRVLKLVDHDRAEALARALADLLVAAEQIARTELEILEVECSFARLRLAVLRGELCEQLLEEPPVACRELLQRRGDGGLARLDERRRARPAGLHLRQGEQPLGQGRGGQKVEHALGGAALKLGRARIVDEAEGSLAQVRHALVEPGARSRLEHEVPAGRAKSCVDADEHLPQPRRAVRREQAPAVGLVRRAEPLERGRERLRLHHESLRLVEHAECRVDPCGERMGAEQASAEAVDRRYPGPVELERQIGAFALQQTLADPGAQLAGGALGVRDHEQRLDIEAIVDDGADEPLDEHRRLAGPGPGSDEHAAGRLDRRPLLVVRGRPHDRSLRQIRQRSHQCGQSPPCGSWRTSPPRIRSTRPAAVPRARSIACENSSGSR